MIIPSITQILSNPVIVIAIIVFGAFMVGLFFFFIIVYSSMNSQEASEEVTELLAETPLQTASRNR